jgi:lipopolysaccharide export system protein LptC
LTGGADVHTRLVGAAKFALPLLGLALLSSLFLLAGIGDPAPGERVPQAEGVAAERRLTAPFHAGVTEAGEAVEISADVARPDPADPRRMEGEGLRARVVTPRGSDLVLTAPRGRIDTGAGTAMLSGGIRLEGSAEDADPIRAETQAMRLELHAGRAESEGAVSAEASMGRLEAGSLLVDGPRLEFRDGVRLRLAAPER